MKKRITIFLAIGLMALGLMAQDREHVLRLSDFMKPKGLALPAFVAGQYLTNDGTALSWGALDLSPYIRRDGTTPLTADWNVGAFDLTCVDMNATNLNLSSGGVLSMPTGGAATTPNFRWGTGGTGFYSDGYTINVSLSRYRLYQFTDGAFFNYTGIAYMGVSSEVKMVAESAGVLQMGVDAASPVAQTIHGSDGSGTDKAGGAMTIGAGSGTGTGAGGTLKFATAPAAAGTGSTKNALVDRVSIDSTGKMSHLGVNSQATNVQQAMAVVTTTAAATATATNLIPAGSMVVGVTTRVTTAVTGDAGFTGFSIGDGSDVDRWGANVTPSLDETTDLTDCTITSPAIYAAATSVVLTQVGGSTFVAGGVVRVTVHYISLTAPNT